VEQLIVADCESCVEWCELEQHAQAGAAGDVTTCIALDGALAEVKFNSGTVDDHVGVLPVLAPPPLLRLSVAASDTTRARRGRWLWCGRCAARWKAPL